ncbi:hypothetical protein [Halotia branconii]|uniref:Uncharacterized protein n=1 Tax=Halotia branconii CENA392 TaxID=1539056 RepID=A0AAJ6NT48_9CYAN|nr:hypothetical protein [Halotia branconii]WGV26132.1 hypothetical protein QI031_01030 [Halotia branconii CENA392]
MFLITVLTTDRSTNNFNTSISGSFDSHLLCVSSLAVRDQAGTIAA